MTKTGPCRTQFWVTSSATALVAVDFMPGMGQNGPFWASSKAYRLCCARLRVGEWAERPAGVRVALRGRWGVALKGRITLGPKRLANRKAKSFAHPLVTAPDPFGYRRVAKSRGAIVKVLKKIQKLAEGSKVFWKIKNFPNLGTSPRFFGVYCHQNRP